MAAIHPTTPGDHAAMEEGRVESRRASLRPGSATARATPTTPVTACQTGAPFALAAPAPMDKDRLTGGRISTTGSMLGDGYQPGARTLSQLQGHQSMRVGQIPLRSLVVAATHKGKVAKALVEQLRKVDCNEDSQIDAQEFLDAVEALVHTQKTLINARKERRLFIFLTILSMMVALLTIGATVGLSAVVAERLKDTGVSDTVLVVKGTEDPVRVANTEFRVLDGSLVARGSTGPEGTIAVATRLLTREDCPLNQGPEALLHMEQISIPVQGGTAFLRAQGYARTATKMTFFTNLGELTISGDCETMSGAAIAELEALGYLPPPASGAGAGGAVSGRRLLDISKEQVKTTFRWVSTPPPRSPPPFPPLQTGTTDFRKAK